MQIHVGYELIYDCPQPTPMILTLNVHYSRASDLVEPDHLVTSPRSRSRPIATPSAIGAAGSSRRRAGCGSPPTRWSTTPACRTPWRPGPQQRPVQALPEETLVFLLGSRYCETDLLSEMAWKLFGGTPPGWARVQAICDFVHQHITFGYEHASATKTAWQVFNERKGVCRDYAHLAIAFCRCLNIPGALLHRLSRRHRRAAAVRTDGLRRLVRGLPGGRVVHLRRRATTRRASAAC